MGFFLFKSDFFIFIFPYELLCLYHVCTVSLETRQGHQISGVIDGYATQCSCWEQNPRFSTRTPCALNHWGSFYPQQWVLYDLVIYEHHYTLFMLNL